jgi:hypothetical protein
MVKFRALLAVLSLMAVTATRASAHPIHMSYTDVHYSAATGSIEISIRVYANDFSAAAARRAHVSLRVDSLIDGRNALDYVRQNFQIIDASGKAVNPTPCGVTRSQDMLRFCFRLQSRGDFIWRVRNTVMTELFSDQVNVVQIAGSKGRKTVLYVRGDGWKAL